MLKGAIIRNGEYEIKKAEKKDYAQLMVIWESSVKATHHFLKTEDIEYYKKMIPDFFRHVDLYILYIENNSVAFMGVSDKNLEMLFVSAEARGRRAGKILLKYAINNLGITKVDVNEQNMQAVGFYEKYGFKITARSEKDSMGKNYPILHLSVEQD